MKKKITIATGLILILGFFACVTIGKDTNSLNYRNGEKINDGFNLKIDAAQQFVSAEIDSMPLSKFLENLSKITGWNVYVEPGTTHTVSAKFKQRPIGEAMRLLLGNLSYALVPQTNNPPKFLVFSTAMEEATQFIKPVQSDASLSKPIPDELIVRLKKGEKPDKLFESLGAKVIGYSEALNSYRLKFADEDSAKRARDYLKNNNLVASVDDNYLYRKPSDVAGLLLGYSPETHLNQPANNSGNKFVIGLIDTVVQKTDSPVDSFLLPSVSIAGDSKPPEDQPTHGTAMAETILRGIASVLDKSSTDIKILPLDAYGQNDATTTFEVALGINAAIENNAKIINLSLGGSGDSPFLHDVVKQARNQGIIIFAAAGNTPDGAPVYPAAYPEVIAVTSGDRRGNIAQYANNGDFVDLVAPGTSIITFNGQSYLVSGTSASSAFASGLAAGIASQNNTTTADLEKILRQTLAIPEKNTQN